MPRKSRESRETIAIQPSKGKKISFDAKSDRQVDNIPQGSTSFTSAFSSAELQSDEESDDEAPEAVGLSEVKELEDQEAQQEETETRARREAATKRLRKIASIKSQPPPVQPKVRHLPNAPGTKRKRKAEPIEEEEDNGPEARRLRARMSRAMEGGEEDAEDEERSGEGESGPSEAGSAGRMEGDEDEDGNDDQDAESFHTESEAGDSEADNDDESERLEEGPINEQTRRLRVRMQAAMEAAERRAGGVDAPPPPVDPPRPSKKAATQDHEDAMYDLGPLLIIGKPLPASMLRAAAAAETEKKRIAAEAKAVAQKNAPKRKKAKRSMKGRENAQQIERKISEKKTLHLLPPTLTPSIASLPPIIGPQRRPEVGKNPREAFYKSAMKESGNIPGKGIVDGRKKVVQGKRR